MGEHGRSQRLGVMRIESRIFNLVTLGPSLYCHGLLVYAFPVRSPLVGIEQ